MPHKTTHDSGHTLHAGHIEAPTTPFEIEWEAPERTVHCESSALVFEAGTRWARVLAVTEEGAKQIARYHNPSGSGFRPRVTLEYIRSVYGRFGIEIEEMEAAFFVFLNDEALARVPKSEGMAAVLKAIEDHTKLRKE